MCWKKREASGNIASAAICRASAMKRTTKNVCQTWVKFYTRPSLKWALTSLQASGLAESIMRKRGVAQQIHPTYKLLGQSQWCRATLHLSHPLGYTLGQPLRQDSALVREGTYASPQESGRQREGLWVLFNRTKLQGVEPVPTFSQKMGIGKKISGLTSLATSVI